MVLWQRTDQHVMVLTGVLRWIVLACGALAGVVLVVSFYALWPVDMLGVRPIWLHLRARTMPASPFVVRGPYRFVRHPLYSCVIVLLWATPDMTADRLLLAASWSAWICIGALLEERDLVADFGDAYRRYQRQVPMLVPWRGRVQVRSEDAAGTRLLPT